MIVELECTVYKEKSRSRFLGSRDRYTLALNMYSHMLFFFFLKLPLRIRSINISNLFSKHKWNTHYVSSPVPDTGDTRWKLMPTKHIQNKTQKQGILPEDADSFIGGIRMSHNLEDILWIWSGLYFSPETQCLHVQKRLNLLVDDTFHPLIHTLTGFLKESTERKSESIVWKQAYFLHQLPVLDIIFLFIFGAKTHIWIKLHSFQFGPSFSILCLRDCLLICYNSCANSRCTC